jgi:hypothetical protein
MTHAIEANIPLGPLNKVSVATNINRDESVRAPAARPAGKAFGLYIRCWIIPPPIRAKGISPTLAIEFARVEKVVALLHRRLHFLLISATAANNELAVNCDVVRADVLEILRVLRRDVT